MTPNEESGVLWGALWSCETVSPRIPKMNMDEHYEYSGLVLAIQDKIHAQLRGVERVPSHSLPPGIYYKGVFSNTQKQTKSLPTTVWRNPE